MKDFKALGKDVEASRNLEWFPVEEGDCLLDSRTTALEVTLESIEFTCRCPVTNQPDWATIVINYGAKDRIVESKSVKLYMETFRDEPIFNEHLARVILKDFVGVLHPHWCTVTVIFNLRGGIAITAKASYEENLKVDAPWHSKEDPGELTWHEPGIEDPRTVDMTQGVEHAVPFPDSVETVPWYDTFTRPHD